MTTAEIREWLFENGGEIIKYAVGTNKKATAKQLFNNAIVRYWVDCFQQVVKTNRIHDGFDYCFENSMAKLLQFGITDELPVIREIQKYLTECVEREIIKKKRVFKHANLDILIVICYLQQCGYQNESIIIEYLQQRLEKITETIRKYKYAIYVKKAGFKGISKSFEKKPLINPDIANENGNTLPNIWDIFNYRSVFDDDSSLSTKDNSERINIVLKYIFTPEYQSLPEGYGIQYSGNKKYYAAGWSVHLPYYDNEFGSDLRASKMMLYIYLLSVFPYARTTEWFKRMLCHLAGFRNTDNTYTFPKNYLREKKHNYFITGNHMGMGENRRLRDGIKIESTYWMNSINKKGGRKR